MQNLKSIIVIINVMLLFSTTSFSQEPGELFVKVVDVGNGLCCVVKTPDNKYMIYDAGTTQDKGKSAWAVIQKMIKKGSDIELMVLSHYDEDHIGAADSIIINYNVKTVYQTGYGIENPKKDSTKTFKSFGRAMMNSTSTKDVNLNKLGKDIEPGTEINIGDVKVNFLCGFGKPLDKWLIDKKNKEGLANSTSIVMRVEYKNKSILFCGDAVGWDEELTEDTVIATESFIVENVPEALIKCDVLIAPQHGSLEGSSYPFVEKAKPKYVIFSAGTGSDAFPRYTTVDRYKYYGSEYVNMFRTDRGDGFDEFAKPYTKPKEWDKEAITKCVDKLGDDDVRIAITLTGGVQVGYMNIKDPCK